MHDQPKITIGAAEDKARLIQTLVLSFASDPVSRWSTPKADEFLANMPGFFALFGGKAFDHGTAYVANDGQAVALWLPPGVDPDEEAMAAAVMEPPHSENLEDVLNMFGQMAAYHPEEPCWYLPVIGADPAFLGQGLGGALMKHALRKVDEDGGIAYLESSNERNVSLYERHGFEVMGEIQVGTSPVMRPMIRAAR